MLSYPKPEDRGFYLGMSLVVYKPRLTENKLTVSRYLVRYA
jgi:hypothetical protein